MLTPQDYSGREQSYIKHLFLSYYLKRVAYNIFSHQQNFFYIDGFSGPWKSMNERNQDTSVYLAALTFNRVAAVVNKSGGLNKSVHMICVEKKTDSFKKLEIMVKYLNEKLAHVEIIPLFGEFESKVPEIAQIVGNQFSLTFVDPTGWKGLSIEKLSPIFELRGEVIINFMTEHIRRFIGKDTVSVDIERQLGWRLSEQDRISLSRLSGVARDELLVHSYCEKLQDLFNYLSVVFTSIRHADKERNYFHLVYATRHVKGLIEFRSVERKVFEKEVGIRFEARARMAPEQESQGNLLSAFDTDQAPKIEYERRYTESLYITRKKILRTLNERKQIRFQELIVIALKQPYIDLRSLSHLCTSLQQSGELIIQNWTARRKILRKENLICLPDYHEF